MLFITGDEAGLLKFTHKNNTQVYGKQDKTNPIRKLCWFKDNILVGKKSIDLVSMQGVVLDSIDLELKESEFLIGMDVTADDLIIACTNLGTVYETKDFVTLDQWSLGLDELCVMKLSPSDKCIAVGGKERDLQVWDIQTRKNCWSAKNVAHNFLNLRIPIWITDLEWGSDTTLFTVTGHGHVRKYDMKQRRPLYSFEQKDASLKAMHLQNQTVTYSDSMGGLYSLKDEKIIGSFKGIAGAITCITMVDDCVIAGGLDRFLYCFDGKRKCLLKVYLKQRITCVLAKRMPQEEEQQDDIDDLLSGMAKVKKSKRA